MSERRVVIVENKHSSHHTLAVPVTEYLEEEIGSSSIIRVRTTPSHEETQQRLAATLRSGDLVVSAGGDGTHRDTTNGMIHAGLHDVAALYLPCGGENDTSYALHRERGLWRLGVVARLSALRGSDLPIRDARPFHVVADGRDLGYGVTSSALGTVAHAAEWLEDPTVKNRLNARGRGIMAKLAIAVEYYNTHGKHYRMPTVRHNGGRERMRGATILVMNDERIAGTWRSVLARGAIFSDRFLVGHYQGMWQLPRSIVFGAQSLTGLMHGRLRTREEVEIAGRPVELQIDGEPSGKVQRIVFAKGPDAPRVAVVDDRRIIEQQSAA